MANEDGAVTLRIEGSGPLGKDHDVFLGGVDISACVNRVQIDISANGPDKAVIHYSGHIELPDELLAKVRLQKVLKAAGHPNS